MLVLLAETTIELIVMSEEWLKLEPSQSPESLSTQVSNSHPDTVFPKNASHEVNDEEGSAIETDPGV